MRRLEIWASPEPTIVRLDNDRVRDQTEETGHCERDDDIERLAALKVCGSRYPVLWESVRPLRDVEGDYAWSRRRIDALQSHGIEPIITLLHHGSGPRYTNLVDDAFPELFAEYAEATARRFPEVRRWTPINEPLTTARFSTLYGVWYPNLRDNCAFARAMVNQARAILLAFARIRSVIPTAELLLTEDLQSYRAANRAAIDYVEYKRERSRLSLDLLCGNVRPGHALWTHLVEDCAIAPSALEQIRRLARPPDLMGWNYYPNSERFVTSEPSSPGHDNVALVDVAPELLNPRQLLRDAWRRFRIPMALSEVHVYGSESERVRWLLQRYDDVVALRSEGVDIRALGAWAAFGMIDWNSLLQTRAGCAEDGIYTCGAPGRPPEPTAVADALRSLSSGVRPNTNPLPGWWERRRSA